MDKNLVTDANEFFDYNDNTIELTEQCEMLIDKLKNSDKIIGILRLTGNITKGKTKYNVFKYNKEYTFKIHIVLN